MKISNFIDPIDPAQEHRFNRWLMSSVILLGSCIMLITYMEFIQLHQLISNRTTYKHYAQLNQDYDQIIKQKNILTAQEQDLKEKINLISSCSYRCARCIDHLKGLSTLSPDIHLNSYSNTDQETSLCVTCPTIAHAQQFATNLSAQCKLNNISVTSVQQDGSKGLLVKLQALSQGV